MGAGHGASRLAFSSTLGSRSCALLLRRGRAGAVPPFFFNFVLAFVLLLVFTLLLILALLLVFTFLLVLDLAPAFVLIFAFVLRLFVVLPRLAAVAA